VTPLQSDLPQEAVEPLPRDPGVDEAYMELWNLRWWAGAFEKGSADFARWRDHCRKNGKTPDVLSMRREAARRAWLSRYKLREALFLVEPMGHA
jgi:hypothetical protein